MMHWITTGLLFMLAKSVALQTNRGSRRVEKKRKNTYRESVSLTLNHSLVSPGKGLYKLMDELPHFFHHGTIKLPEAQRGFSSKSPFIALNMRETWFIPEKMCGIWNALVADRKGININCLSLKQRRERLLSWRWQ